MNEILKVNYESDTPTVSARDLYEALEVNTPFTMWFDRMTEYGFEEGKDFITKMLESTGGRPSTDYETSIDMAKEICMLQRTEKGKQCRQYFIDLEKAWNTPEQIFARALKMADKVISQKEKLIAELKPKAEFFDAVADSKSAIAIGEVAKVLGVKGMGRNSLFELLRNNRILMDNNQPYQRYIDAGYFRVVEQKYTKPNGDTEINIKTLVYQKGVDYIRKLVS